MTSIISLTPQQLRKAAAIKESILHLQEQLTDLLGAAVDTGTPAPATKRRMSAAGRARIAAATKLRWAKSRAEGKRAKRSKKAKRRMSAQARARLSEIAKARWKKARRQGKTML